ncbi:MAG: pectin methylesterase, partial [Firmicutes bacterium]|nr:pectin methylesterase [Bacillota bacterium]
MRITVAKDETGDFKTVREAIASVNADSGAEIFIKNGYYFEKVIIDKPNITIIGEDIEKTVIIYNDSALRLNDKGEPLGTYGTATLEATANAVNTRIENLTIENSAGYGKIVGQAVALSAGGDRSVFKKLRLIGRQDTLMLPPCFREAQEKPDLYVRQYFEDCYIEGDVDFIFGGAAAVFKNCDIFCKHRPIGYNCFITAACTPENLPYGFVF